VRKSRKATFSLGEDLLRDVDEAVRDGAAPSKNAFVETALRRELAELRRRERRRRWEEGAKDPLLMADVAAVETDFAVADAETAARIV
jgi:Arc/MetJ-type ribon-helix-helix transcriptional regulator